MAASVISPELALIDPILRTDALGALPHVEPFDFLRFPEPVAPRTRSGHPPLVLAAAVYAASAAARVAVMDGLFVLALAAAVLAVNVLH
jgi:hypothetical protein